MRGRRYQVTVGEESHVVEIVEIGDGRFRARVDDEDLDVDARLPAAGPCSLLVGNRVYLVDVIEDGEDLVLGVGGPREPASGPRVAGGAAGRARWRPARRVSPRRRRAASPPCTPIPPR